MRAGTSSASIQSASSCGSSKQCDESRAPVASLRKAGEKSTAFTRCASPCRDEIARKFVVHAIAEHEFHLIVRPEGIQICQIECVRLTGMWTLHIHNLNDRFRHASQWPLPTGLNQHLVTSVHQELHEWHQFALLQHRLSACDFD